MLINRNSQNAKMEKILLLRRNLFCKNFELKKNFKQFQAQIL